MLLIFSPEPIFKRNSLASLARASKRSRGLSDVSLNSLHSIPSEDEVIYRNGRPSRQPFAPPLNFSEAVQQNFANRLPRRQPLPPPPNSLAQHHAGFARFLKEHASPPHQRVTAGGRIVPAGGPPPVFNVDSLRALTPSSAAPKQTDSNPAGNELATQNVRVASDAVVPASSEYTARESGTSSHRQTGTAFIENMRQVARQEAEKQQMQLRPTSKASTPNTPITLPDGSSVMFHNAIPYRLYWNGFQNVVEPVIIQYAPMPGSTATSVQQVGLTSQYSMGNPYATPPNLSMMTSNLSSAQSLVPTHLDQSVPDHVLQRQQENLRYELKKLDKHIALRSHTFSSAEHATHVAQRKHLVEQMDTIRVMRGHRDRTTSDTTNMFGSHVNPQDPAYRYIQGHQNATHNPYMLANTGPAGTSSGMTAHTLVIGPPWDALINGTHQVTNPTDAKVQSQQRTPSMKVGSGASKVLSPEAPPFVPSNMQGNHARKIETCLPHDQHSNDRKVVNGSPSTKASTGDKSLAPSGKEIRSHSKLATSGSWSAMDDVVPVVHQTDIAYADDLGLNPVDEPKLYCSTVTEFQEVIRRVREQARLYGCEGGQSKDPEFDAEQDIRWAIADSSPVPLPKKMPDHIANPRPWNWNDSAFNVRADRSHLKSTKKSTVSSWPESLKAAPSTSIEAKAVSGNVSVQGEHGTASMSTDAAQRKTKPASNNNSDPFGDSKQASSFEGTRTVLGELPINNQTTLTADTATAIDNHAGSIASSQKDVYNGKATRHALLEVPNAETLLKDKIPTGRQSSADNGKVTALERRPYHAYVEDDEDSLGGPTVPEVVVTSATPQNEEVVEEPVAPKFPLINGKKSAFDMTMEELDAEIAANPPDPNGAFPIRPQSPGWDDIPLPPEILSKMPYNMEDLQRSAAGNSAPFRLLLTSVRGPQGDPSVHMPNIHHPPNTNVESSKLGAKPVGTRPFGYNEHKPISIPR